MKHLKYISALIVGIAIYGCIPEPLEMDEIKSIKPQIVVSSQIIPNESLVVLLTKSFGALDVDENSDPLTVLDKIAVNDAIVVIQGKNSSDTLLFLGNGSYGGIDIPFVENESYELIAESKTLGSISAVTTVKPRITFDDVDAGLIYDATDTVPVISYQFSDPIEKNWYILSVLRVNKDELQEHILDPREYTRLIEDTDENTHAYSDLVQLPWRFDPGDTVAIYLANVNEAYFDFMQLRQDSRFSLLEYLSEPVNYPSNVNGGRGFFNLTLPDIQIRVIDSEDD